MADTDADQPGVMPDLNEEDRRVLSLARQCTDLIARVDRVPPAELFETILAESKYAYELRPRRRQAWENVKKMRSLVRRLQNRGYADGPIADHLDSLTAGDESNAVLEALDAVNLMTVHASKGLEFPIVVNMSCASGPPRPVRLTVDADGDASRRRRSRSARSYPKWKRRNASARSTKRNGCSMWPLLARDRLHSPQP